MLKKRNSNIFPNIYNSRKNDYKKFFSKIFKINSEYKNIGKNKKYFLRTYGCQTNLADSENIKGMLEMLNFKSTDNIYDANLIILNTCAVRENAEDKVFGELGFLKKHIIENNVKIGLCGCMMQEDNIVKKIIDSYKFVSFVIGTSEIYQLPEVLDNMYNSSTTIVSVKQFSDKIMENIPIKRLDNHKAFINIMYGCNHFCTYCIVPFTRGQIKSRLKKDILNEVIDLKKNGYKEVTLLGANVNDYGIDRNDGYTFANLLEDVCKTGIMRVRFVTSNPWNFSNDIIDCFKKYNNLMPYFHIPIQSGSDNILEKMNRKMKIKDYVSLINKIRQTCSQCSISTDIIVGFPNETNKDFKKTLKLYKQIKFDNAYTFIYSKRINTPAAKLEDSISIEQKEKRLSILNALVKKYAKKNNKKYVGKTLQVLVDGKSKTNQNMLSGYSREWKLVNFSGKCKVGDIVDIYIDSASNFSLNGHKI